MLRSLKSRLTLLYVVILAAILTLFATSLYFSARRELLLDFEETTASHGREFAELYFSRFTPDSNVGHVKGVVIGIWDGSGKPLSGDNLPYEQFRSAETGLRLDIYGERHMFAIVRPKDSRGDEYLVAYGRSEAAIQERLKRLLYYFAFFVPAMLLLAWYVGRVFVRRSLSPVDALRRQAEQIQKSNLSQRVPIPATRGEIRDLAITMNDMLGRLESSFDQINSFTSNASHELKTPLANLRTEIELALEKEADVGTYQRLLASVSEEVSRMTHIVQNLLLLAQLDSKQAALKQEPVDVSEVAKEALGDMEILGETRGVQVRAGMIAPDVRVQGDAVALRRVFMNLLENGVKYNREGGEVKLSVWKEDSTARVEVSDTGMGIPADSIPHLFDRFYRVDRSRGRSAADAVGGHGLGLSITRSLVEAHGGKIDVTSKEGVGTTFHVVLPSKN